MSVVAPLWLSSVRSMDTDACDIEFGIELSESDEVNEGDASWLRKSLL